MNQLPLHNIEAEESVIGSILIDDSMMSEVSRKVKPDDFYSERNRSIYESCVQLKERRERINQITLAQELDRQGKLQNTGGAAYLSHLISIVPTSLDAPYYADIVRRLALYWQLEQLSRNVSDIATAADPDTNASLDRVSGLINDFRREHTTIDDLITPVDMGNRLLELAYEYQDMKLAIPWGYKDLDRMTAGIFPELTIIGARPSIGKTELMLNIIENIKHHKILFVSAEMDMDGILERKIARRLGIGVATLRRGKLTDEQLGKISDLAGEVSQELVACLPPGVTSGGIYNKVQILKQTTGVDIVFIDYLQILRDCWNSSKENMRIRVGTACKTLKAIVNDFKIPVLCASQLNRELEHRAEDSRRPRLADLRETGDIEQDADNVLLLWRDKDNPNSLVSNVLEVKIAKGRQIGDFPKIDLIWLPGERRYADSY